MLGGRDGLSRSTTSGLRARSASSAALTTSDLRPGPPRRRGWRRLVCAAIGLRFRVRGALPASPPPSTRDLPCFSPHTQQERRRNQHTGSDPPSACRAEPALPPPPPSSSSPW